MTSRHRTPTHHPFNRSHSYERKVTMSVFRRLSAGALTALLVVLAAVAAPTLSTAAGAGQLTITNLDVLPTSTSAVMTKIQNPADSSQRMHDKVTVQQIGRAHV